MSTRRYCGDITIYLELHPTFDAVKSKITRNGKVLLTDNISIKNVVNNGLAVDSSEAFDQYANSAISFMEYYFDGLWFEHDKEIPEFYLVYCEDLCSYYIRRKK